MTAQMREHIIIDGKDYDGGLATEPLQPLLDEIFSDTYPRISWNMTACYRGYVGHWEIKNNELYFNEMTPSWADELMLKVSPEKYEVFDWKKILFNNQTLPIKAVWFTGQLVVEIGELLMYHHSGYDSVYEKYMLIDIQAGNVIHKEIKSGKEYRPDDVIFFEDEYDDD